MNVEFLPEADEEFRARSLYMVQKAPVGNGRGFSFPARARNLFPSVFSLPYKSSGLSGSLIVLTGTQCR